MMGGSLEGTARALVASGKGLLAMDESNATCDKRLVACGIAPGAESRRRYRELIVTAPGLGESISGAILYDETLRQCQSDGTAFGATLLSAGILPGIKVDIGAKDLAGHAGEKVTEGLDNLRGRLQEYQGLGARFAKWRAVFALGHGLPSRACIAANVQALARYAALCQEAGLVPIVEPEVLMDGDHDLEACRRVTTEVLHQLFSALYLQDVSLAGVILKPNMILPGLTSSARPTADEVAVATLDCLLATVPGALPGIAFLSGGQNGILASARLNALCVHARRRDVPAPWALTFSYARALQHPALDIWKGLDEHRLEAQQALVHRARCNWAALRGEYDAAWEAP